MVAQQHKKPVQQRRLRTTIQRKLQNMVRYMRKSKRPTPGIKNTDQQIISTRKTMGPNLSRHIHAIKTPLLPMVRNQTMKPQLIKTDTNAPKFN